MSTLRLATIADTDRLMRFMHEHWRADHILSRNRELFLFDFQDGEQLNIAIAEDANDNLIGLFGFIKYNSHALPDLAGSLWKALDSAGEPMLGLRLRRFVMQNVPHRYFAAPGAGLQTRAIYHLIRMHWIEMDHYYRLNPDIRQPQLYQHRSGVQAPPAPATTRDLRISEIADPRRLQAFPFSASPQVGPLKDWAYLHRRFFEHPINRYRVFLSQRGDEPVNIAVCRVARHDQSSALRIVDLYGAEKHIAPLIAHLDKLVRKEGHEYLDFVCSGFDPAGMHAAGFSRLDFDDTTTVIPNFFEPFLKQNVRVYAVADRHASIVPRLCKADGDQDRPNFDTPAQASLDTRPARAVQR